MITVFKTVFFINAAVVESLKSFRNVFMTCKLSDI